MSGGFDTAPRQRYAPKLGAKQQASVLLMQHRAPASSGPRPAPPAAGSGGHGSARWTAGLCQPGTRCQAGKRAGSSSSSSSQPRTPALLFRLCFLAATARGPVRAQPATECLHQTKVGDDLPMASKSRTAATTAVPLSLRPGPRSHSPGPRTGQLEAPPRDVCV